MGVLLSEQTIPADVDGFSRPNTDADAKVVAVKVLKGTRDLNPEWRDFFYKKSRKNSFEISFTQN